MPVHFTQIPLEPQNGIVTVTRFVPPYDGRKVMFTGVGHGQRIYTLINGNLADYRNGQRMKTGVRGLERFLGSSYYGYAIVVSNCAFVQGPISVPVNPVTARFSDGYVMKMEMDCSVELTISVCDMDGFVDSYAQSPFNPELTIRNDVREIIERFVRGNSRLWMNKEPHSVISETYTLSEDLLEDIRREVEERHSWCSVSRCTGGIHVRNQDAVNQRINKRIEEWEAFRRKMMDILLNTPASVSQCIQYYIAHNGGMDIEAIEKAAMSLTELYNRVNSNTFNQAVQIAGIAAAPDYYATIGGNGYDVPGNYLGSGYQRDES